ncbi:fish-egg lectin-like [Siniperca chuatsi]|uniref:fish-egg lectin-like n=1 Tax=Siniperca chuatsi TaxID=119488 RepID=UPI001CE1081D|nr:fish-egg lectin-like [Siniperca chuatsi]
MRAVAAYLLVLCYGLLSTAWTYEEVPGPYPTVQTDAGQGEVVATDSNNYAYFLSGTAWHRLGSVTIKPVSVGPAGIWGADTSNRVKITPTTCEISGWQQVSGSATMVEVATDGSVFVVNRAGLVYQRTGISSSRSDLHHNVHLTYDLGHL